MTPALELRSLGYTFPGSPAPTLTDVHLKLRAGESLGIVGHNGSGKSTLLRLISTLLAPTTGEVVFEGETGGHARVRPRISFSAGAPLGFYPRLTGPENLRLFASFKGRALDVKGANRLMERVGLGHAQSTIYFRYSLGMRQRLHLARLLLPPHDFVFVDEPSNGLDPQGLELLVDLFRNELGSSTRVIISHDHALLARLTSRQLNLQSGRLHEL